MQYYKMF